MNKQESILLLDSMYPNFFERENVRSIPDEWTCDEMILSLDKFEPHKYDKKLEDNISFGYYEGDIDELKKAVERVVQYWAQSYDEKQRIYCGYINGNVASFCLIEDKGVYNINGREVKIGGPWYEKLGYKTSVRWTKNGVVQQMIFSKWDYVRLGYSEVKKKSAITCEWSL